VSEGRFIGLAGLGNWGRNIFRNLDELGLLRAACDTDAEILEGYRQEGSSVELTGDFEALLSNPEVRAVAIATPAATHYSLARRALEKGLDVFVEKPLALTLEEGQELVDLASGKELILMVGHVLRYHPAVGKLKELISSGGLGQIQYIYSNRLNIGRLRTEENILWSFAPHDISVILMLLEEEPVKVSAFGGDYLSRGVCDTTMTTLEFSGGIKGHIFVSWLHPFKEQKLVIVGSEGMAVFDDVSSEKLLIYPHRIEWKEGRIPVARKADFQRIPVEAAEPLREELKHFADCVNKRMQPLTDGREAMRVLRVLRLAEETLAPFPEGQPSTAFVHGSACVDEGVSLGEGTRIWHFSHILKGTVIGRDCVIGQNVMIGPGVAVGDRCKIQNNVSVYRGVTLEDEVFCGPSCVFTNVYNPRAFIERKEEFMPTLVKRGATIGANATVVCGVTIGRYAMVGAGAVVKDDIPDHAVAAGVPARLIGWACRCGTTLQIEGGRALCRSCREEYALEDDLPVFPGRGDKA
jgi:UDP-2-acetamido-3-amino-2,3-dideoxy-glucuronate N-acetyltransferase